MADAQKNTKVTVQAILCWSEFYNGKWQPTKTSDVNRPAKLGDFVLAGKHAFDRSALRLEAFEESSALRIFISGQGSSSFLLYNTHSLPLEETPDTPPNWNSIFEPYIDRPYRWLHTSRDNTLTITYYKNLQATLDGQGGITRPVLTNNIRHRIIGPQTLLSNAWEAPFF